MRFSSIKTDMDFFEVTDPNDENAQWLSATNIIMQVKQQAGSAFKAPSANTFGRMLMNLPNIQHKRSGKLGELYCARPRF